jgi:hypothetical protein
VLYLRLIILLVGDDVSVDIEALLMTDFMNFKINPAQSFRDAHKNRMCERVFIIVSAYTSISIYIL